MNITKQRVEKLLSDMRRKYMHAVSKEDSKDANWLAGDPITTRILEHWIPEIETLVASLPDETNGNDAEDAAKWRAFRNCARIRVLGSAGFTRVEPYRFITLEAWTQHDARSSVDAITILEEFVACARQCSPEKPTVDGINNT